MTYVIFTWQEFQYVVKTLDDGEFEKVDIRKIRELLDADIIKHNTDLEEDV